MTSVSATMEDYLEAILQLVDSKGTARSRDIAEVLSIHPSTVTSALRNLASKDLINYQPYENVTLTKEGRRIAEEVASTHNSIESFLTDVLLLGDDLAARNACRMEHDMDPEVLERLGLFARFLTQKRNGRSSPRASFSAYLKRHRNRSARKDDLRKGAES